jgi:hypothetical protein
MIESVSLRLPLWFLFLAAGTLHAFTQGGATVDPALTPNSAPHTLRGTVVNSVTGEPVYRALVQLGGEHAMLTDHDGHFEFDGVTDSFPVPFVMKPGYFAVNRGQGFVSDPAASLNASGADQSLTVKLVPEGIISGTVTGQDGTPLEGIPVQLKTRSVQDGISRWRQRMGTRTNSEGQYRFAELEAGSYIVTSGFHVEGLADSASTFAYIPARYPNGGASSPETAIAIKPGDHAIADLNPDVARLYPVTGVITGFAEARGIGWRAQTASGEEITPMARFLPPTGEFRLMMPSGTYQVTATAYTREGPFEARRELTVAQGPLGGVSFALQPYATIPVEVNLNPVNQVAQGDGPMNGSLQGLAANVMLTSADGEGVTPYLSAQPLRRHGALDDNGPNAPGPLAIENISPGRYLLQVQPQSPWYVASATCGGLDLTRQELVVAGGSVGCSIRIELRNDSGSASATIRGAAQIAGAANPRLFVCAVPLGNLTQRIVDLNPQNSTYSADSLAPGRYLVLALDHRENLPYRDPEAMAKFAGLGQEITVTANGKAETEVSLIAGNP